MKLRNVIPARSAWLVGVSLIAGLLATWGWLAWGNDDEPSKLAATAILRRFLIYSGIICAALLLAPPVFRWLRPALCRLFCPRNLKRALSGGTVCFVLFALLHLVENWRGRRAWESFKREWEAKGERFDFASYVPPPVPDEQNFALTPIVASCYSHVLDRSGHRVTPEATNVVNRLEMELCRRDLSFSSNMVVGLWHKSQFTDLKAWQDHYRATSITNVTTYPDAAMLAAFARRYGIKTVATNESPIAIQPPSTVSVRALATNEFPIAAQPQSPAADVLLALSKYAPAIEELRQASRLPCSRFPLEYSASNPSEMSFPHYKSLRAAASVLRLRAIAELNDDQPQTALADLQLIFRLADSIRGEPIELSLRTRLEIVEAGIQPLWEGLARRQWSEDQLLALRREFSDFDLVRDYSCTVRSELAWHLKLADYLRTERMANSFDCMCGEPIFWPTLAYRLSPNGWFYLNQVALARCYLASLPTSTELSERVLSPSVARRFEEAAMRVRRRGWKPTNFLAAFVLPPLDREVRACARSQAALDSARLAIALERFRQANGYFPATLDALSPDLIPKIPHDIVTGEPLRYRRTDDGQFLLYSVGWNEQDDGGEPSPHIFTTFSKPAGDWVWRYPQN